MMIDDVDGNQPAMQDEDKRLPTTIIIRALKMTSASQKFYLGTA